MNEDVKARFKALGNFPSPPGIAQEIIELAKSEEVSIGEVSGAIAKDPALAAKVTNSPVDLAGPSGRSTGLYSSTTPGYSAPVIVGNQTSLPEVVGDAGVLVDPFDVDALSAAIGKVISDSDLRATLSVKGLARAKRFDWRETALGTLGVAAVVGRITGCVAWRRDRCGG